METLMIFSKLVFTAAEPASPSEARSDTLSNSTTPPSLEKESAPLPATPPIKEPRTKPGTPQADEYISESFAGDDEVENVQNVKTCEEGVMISWQ